ncbi:MAG: triose-phosphate isomerase [Anaerolineaceae bacterium]|nr:triose-phosphate isomerase [Anaerolineaceae bacterium]
MRKPFVAGNWKMNNTLSEAKALVEELLPGLKEITSVDRVFCPPYASLAGVGEMLKGTGIGLGAQNMHWAASGAYTGELSPEMVKEFCEYVILGHSERRQYFGETDETVNKRVVAALGAGLLPIVCVGETLEENEAGKTAAVIDRQVRKGLEGIPLDKADLIVVAYEPVWAIGTGKASSATGANIVISDMIRPALKDLFGKSASEKIRVIYGGSVKPANAQEYFEQPDIDGALVGGASLKVDFIEIVKAAVR